MKRIGVLTAGGDAPGMNAAIRSVVRYAAGKEVEVMGIFHGWQGLINEELKIFDRRSVSGIINLGGTILKTARCPEFHTKDGQERAFGIIKKNSIEGLIVIGGDGSFRAAHEFYKNYKVPCICVPASIDNDINGVEETIGSDTAINTALSAIDNIRDTATSMERVFVVEVMGRESGYIALSVALAGGCEEAIIPEKKADLTAICHDIVGGNIRGKVSWIIIVAEGAGKAEDISKKITDLTGLETRAVVLGHIQRGGRPTAASRRLGLFFGEAAVKSLLRGEEDKAVTMVDGVILTIDLAFAITKKVLKIDNLYNLIKTLT